MSRPLSVALTLVLALAVGLVVATRLPPPPVRLPEPVPAVKAEPPPAGRPASELRLGLPDCAASALDDLRGSDALECWFHDETYGDWHVTWSLEIQGTTLFRLIGTDLRVADPIARRLVEQGGAGAKEVLVYARPTRGGEVRRVRWTRRTGYEVTEFTVP